MTARLLEPQPMDGRRRLAFNAAAGGAANLVKVGINLVLLPVMAHLLGPAEFGLYALALPTISFFTVLADGGLGASLARESETSERLWSTAFWVLLAVGVAMAVLVSGWGMVMASLAHQPRLGPIMAFLSLSFVMLTVSVLPAARLTRRGRLVLYAGGDLASNIVGAVVAVGLALAGAGAWSLAAQYVAGFAVRTIVLQAAAFRRPALVFDLALLRPHLSTGSAVIGGRLSEFAGRLAENLLYGRMFGTAALGTFTFANQAPRFLCEAAGNPIWGALYAHALREDPRQVAALHAKLCRLLASVLFPIAMLLSAAAPAIFAVVLGPKWAESATLVQILVPAYALNAVATQSGAILLANGRNAAMFWSLAGLSLGRVLAVASGFWLGPIGVACGFGVANLCYAAAMVVLPRAITGRSAWALIRGSIAPLVSSLLAGAVCFVALMAEPSSLVGTLAAIAAGLAAYALAMVAIEGRLLRADLLSLHAIVFRRRAGTAEQVGTT